MPPLADGRRDPLDLDRSAALDAAWADRERRAGELERAAWSAAVLHLRFVAGYDVGWAVPSHVGQSRETA